MKNLNMYCLTIHEHHLHMIKKIGYIPVGLGENIKSKEFTRDNTEINISEKNPFYGEYTFHYWLWKNNLNNLDDKWIGFCQYRKFWKPYDKEIDFSNLDNFSNSLIKEIPSDYLSYESIKWSQMLLKL